MRYIRLILSLALSTATVFPQSPYKDKILLSGNDYFWTLVFQGWNDRAKYDWDLMRNVYVYNDSLSAFEKYIHLPGDCKKVSPNDLGEKIAVVVIKPNPNKKEVSEYVLIIFDSKGQKIIEIENVYDFEWFPNKEIILYVSGRPSEVNEIGGFTPTGTWVLDLLSQTKEKILNEGYWLSVDEKSQTIFIDNYWKVYAYDYPNRALRETELKGNRFSPDGKYYFRNRGAYWPFVVYETRSNQPVKIPGVDSSAQYAKWLSGKPATLIAGDYDGEKKIIDVGSSKIIGSLSGKILGFSTKDNEAIVIKDKKYLKNLSKPKVEKVKLQ